MATKYDSERHVIFWGQCLCKVVAMTPIIPLNLAQASNLLSRETHKGMSTWIGIGGRSFFILGFGQSIAPQVSSDLALHP